MSKKAVKFIGGIVLVSIAGVAGYGFMHKDQLMDQFSSPAVSEEAAPATEPVEVMPASDAPASPAESTAEPKPVSPPISRADTPAVLGVVVG